MTDWRQRAGTIFTPEKAPVTAKGGMAVTNHPLASAAAVEIMAGASCWRADGVPMGIGGGLAEGDLLLAGSAPSP